MIDFLLSMDGARAISAVTGAVVCLLAATAAWLVQGAYRWVLIGLALREFAVSIWGLGRIYSDDANPWLIANAYLVGVGGWIIIAAIAAFWYCHHGKGAG